MSTVIVFGWPRVAAIASGARETFLPFKPESASIARHSRGRSAARQVEVPQAGIDRAFARIGTAGEES